MPAKPDPDHIDNADLPQRDGLSGIEDAERQFANMVGGRNPGFTIERVGATRPLVLDVRLQMRHVDEVLRFIHLQPAVRDIVAMLRDQELAGVLNGLDPTLIRDMLIPWLDRTHKQQMATPSKFPLADRFFRMLRRTTGVAIMFGNVVNSAQQWTGISNSAVYVRGRFLKNAAWRHLANPRDTAQEVARLSRAMDLRLNDQVGQMHDEIDQLLDPSKWAALQQTAARHGYFMQRFMQNRVDIVTWMAAYDQAMERAGPDVSTEAASREAVAEADSIVRLSQGSTTPEDSARVEALTPFVRLFTQFSSYFNAILNQMESAQPGAARARAALLGFSVPALAGAAISMALRGDWDDEDDDGYLDETAEWFFGSQASAAASLAPGVGPALASLFGSYGGDRLRLAPAFSSIESTFRAVTAMWSQATGETDARGRPKELTGRNVRDLATAVSVWSGIPITPLAKAIGYQVDVARGNITPTGPVDQARGLLTGAASAGSR